MKYEYGAGKSVLMTTLLTTALILATPAPLTAQAGAQPVPGAAAGRAILSQVDALINFPGDDFSAEYTITETKPGEATSRTVFVLFRRDRADTYTILIQEPAQDRGKGYLRIDRNLFLYDPVARRFTVVGTSDRFQNTNARNSDFMRSSLADDYRITAVRSETLGAYQTRVYDLEALHDDVTFPYRRVWIDQNNLARKLEDYSLSRQHMRTTAVPEYRRLSDRYVPVRVVIQDELRGRTIDGRFQNERTLIVVNKESLQVVPDMVFTRTFLERAGR